MFSLSFVGRSRSAEGGPYPPADLDQGSKSRGGSKSAGTLVRFDSDFVDAASFTSLMVNLGYFRLFKNSLKVILSF